MIPCYFKAFLTTYLTVLKILCIFAFLLGYVGNILFCRYGTKTFCNSLLNVAKAPYFLKVQYAGNYVLYIEIKADMINS